MAKTTARIPKGRRSSRGTMISRSRQVPSEEKALFHNLTGRVLRKFFDLNSDDEEAILAKVRAALQTQITKAGA